MNKYVTIENEIFQATLVVETSKTNDEFVPKNRKNGTAGDKNHFLVNGSLYADFGDFFPLILDDKKEKKTNRNNKIIKNYFSISKIFNDLEKINRKIRKDYKDEEEIDVDNFTNLIFTNSKKQNLKSTFYIESEIGAANNGIGFKNWENPFSSTIKQLLLHNTKTNVYLFKKEDEICSYFELNQNYLDDDVVLPSTQEKDNASKTIYFGAPGTGKSYKIKKELEAKQIPSNRIQQVTFHPEYDYNSFVGGYKPAIDENNEITYKFVPQIFTDIYIDAWKNETLDYYLVIEEINRGNCAEIFGDVFQLLDDGYQITPSNELAIYLKSELTENGFKGFVEDKMLMPPNLSILATMNTSDQSLFPMDSAFKRRWDWEYIPINYEQTYINSNGEEKDNNSAKYKVVISDSYSFKWLAFIKKVNTIIKENPNLGMDKCIGNYFIKANSENEISLAEFINKAIFYLWNDVFKDEDEHIFEEKSFYEDFFPIAKNGKDKVLNILLKIGLIEPEKKD